MRNFKFVTIILTAACLLIPAIQARAQLEAIQNPIAAPVIAVEKAIDEVIVAAAAPEKNVALAQLMARFKNLTIEGLLSNLSVGEQQFTTMLTATDFMQKIYSGAKTASILFGADGDGSLLSLYEAGARLYADSQFIYNTMEDLYNRGEISFADLYYTTAFLTNAVNTGLRDFYFLIDVIMTEGATTGLKLPDIYRWINNTKNNINRATEFINDYYYNSYNDRMAKKTGKELQTSLSLAFGSHKNSLKGEKNIDKDIQDIVSAIAKKQKETEEQTITSVTSELKEATSPATKGIILIMAAMALIWMVWNYLRMTISPNAASQDQIRNVIIGFVILILALVFYLSIFGTGGLGLTSDHIESAIFGTGGLGLTSDHIESAIKP